MRFADIFCPARSPLTLNQRPYRWILFQAKVKGVDAVLKTSSDKDQFVFNKLHVFSHIFTCSGFNCPALKIAPFCESRPPWIGRPRGLSPFFYLTHFCAVARIDARTNRKVKLLQRLFARTVDFCLKVKRVCNFAPEENKHNASSTGSVSPSHPCQATVVCRWIQSLSETIWTWTVGPKQCL